MAETGFIRDMLDVKVLILYVMHIADLPLTVQTIYELCYVDDKLSYFDVCEAVPELASRGHLHAHEDGTYTITEHGAETLEATSDSIAFTVRMQAQAVVEKYKKKLEKESRVHTEVVETDGGYSVRAVFDGASRPAMVLELAAPDKSGARQLAAGLFRNAEALYGTIMEVLTEESR